MMKNDRCEGREAGVTAASRPIHRKDRRCAQLFGLAFPAKIPVDSVDSVAGVARCQVTRHEADGVVGRVSGVSPISSGSARKTVDALDHVQSAKIRVTTRDPFAFDDGMWIVFAIHLADLGKANRDVDDAIPLKDFGLGMPLGPGAYPYLFAIRYYATVQCLLHSTAKALRDLDLACAGVDARIRRRDLPSTIENAQDLDAAVAPYVDRAMPSA